MMKKRQKQKPKRAPELMPPSIPLRDLNALEKRGITLTRADKRAEYVKRCEELILESFCREAISVARDEFGRDHTSRECMEFYDSIPVSNELKFDWFGWFNKHHDALIEAAKVVARASPPDSDLAMYARAELLYIREFDMRINAQRAAYVSAIREGRKLKEKRLKGTEDEHDRN